MKPDSKICISLPRKKTLNLARDQPTESCDTVSFFQLAETQWERSNFDAADNERNHQIPFCSYFNKHMNKLTKYGMRLEMQLYCSFQWKLNSLTFLQLLVVC